MTACPRCGRKFSSSKGMHQHHAKVHDETIPNRECIGCGKEFYDPKSRRKFCGDCEPNAGENNGNWQDARESTRCRICGAEFEYYPPDKKGTYCSDCVESSDGLLPEQYPKRIDRVVVDCLNCSSDIPVLPSQEANQERGFFCDLDCYGAWLSENVVGEDHHQWQGGEIAYGQQWWRIRRRALERDDYCCQNCGANARELGQNPDVHHIVPVRKFNQPEAAHTLENVITLCRSCHRYVEEGDLTLGENSDGR